MELATIVIWILLIFILFMVVVGVFYRIFEPEPAPTVNPVTYTAPYDGFSFWSLPSQSSDTSRNTCQLYQFSGSTGFVNVNGFTRERGFPGQPTLDPDIIEQLTPQDPGTCYDVDQVVAAKVSRTCINNPALQDSESTGTSSSGEEGVRFCLNYDGDIVLLGGTEDLYVTNATTIDVDTQQTTRITCTQQPCAGILGLYGVKYFAAPGIVPDENMFCFQSNGQGEISLANCDISQLNQLFRITRTTSIGDVSTVGASNGKTGDFAQIYSRVDDACLTQSPDDPSAITTGECGAHWYLVPQQRSTRLQAPQQTVYIGNLTSEQITALQQAVSAQEMISTIEGLRLKSIQTTGNHTLEGLILAEYYAEPITGTVTPGYLNASTQYINYNLYNDILYSDTVYSF